MVPFPGIEPDSSLLQSDVCTNITRTALAGERGLLCLARVR
jgi:hypothetical protein